MEPIKQGKRVWPNMAQFNSATLPLVQQGVGDALRSAYIPRACDMPKDIAALLAKLN